MDRGGKVVALGDLPPDSARIHPPERIVDIFRGRILDVTQSTYIIEVTGDGAKLDAFINALDRSAIMEVVRSGLLAVGRGEKGLRL